MTEIFVILSLLFVGNIFADIYPPSNDQEMQTSIGTRFLCQYGQHIQDNMYNYTCIIESNPESAFQCYSLVTILQPPFTINWIHATVRYPNDLDFATYPKLLLHTEIQFCGNAIKGKLLNSGAMLEFSDTGTLDECPMAGGTIKVDKKYGTVDEMPLSEKCDTVSYSEATFYQPNMWPVNSALDTIN